MGSRVLKVALDFDTLVSSGYRSELALAEMNDRPGRYDPQVLAALSETLMITDRQVVRRMKVCDLGEGLVLADDIRTVGGTLVCAKGQEVTRAMRLRLRNFLANIGIQACVRVFMPLETAETLIEADSACGGE